VCTNDRSTVVKREDHRIILPAANALRYLEVAAP
jgi:hypothetical protein